MRHFASVCLSVVGPKFRLEINSYLRRYLCKHNIPYGTFTSYNDDGVLHWQMGSHQRQVASFFPYCCIFPGPGELRTKT